MWFIKLLIQKMLGAAPVPANGNGSAVVAASPSAGSATLVMQAPQPPVRLQIDQIPQTLEDAITYVRMGEPTDYSDVVTWHNVCGQLRIRYKPHALNELANLLKNISMGSLRETENAIDTALLNLQMVAPVEWVLDRRHKKDHSDGSRSYRLIGHYAIINPNGAFAITDLNGVIWLDRASVCGTAFVNPLE